MTFTIHAWKNDKSHMTMRISGEAAVDKARALEQLGWQVHVTNSVGERFDSSHFNDLAGLGKSALSEA